MDDGTHSIFPEVIVGNLDRSNSHEVELMESFGVHVWNKGGHTTGMPPEEFLNAFAKTTIFGTDSVRLELVSETSTLLATHTVLPGYLPDAVNCQIVPYGLDFGEVAVGGDPGVQAFITLSTSCDTLHVYDIISSDPHFVVDPAATSFSLASGEEMIVPVLYFPDAVGINTAAILVIGNDPDGPDTVYVVGQGAALGVAEDIPSTPDEFALHGNFPNPFNPATTISYAIPKAANVTLNVYDISGRLVTTLVYDWRNAGKHQITFDGSGLVSGIYIYRLRARDFTASGKMVLIKQKLITIVPFPLGVFL